MAPSPQNSGGNKDKKIPDEVDNEPNNVGVDADKRKQPEENHENGEQPTGLVRLDKGNDGKLTVTCDPRVLAQSTDLDQVTGNNLAERKQPLPIKIEKFIIQMNNLYQHYYYCKDKSRGCETCRQAEGWLNHQQLSPCKSNECCKCWVVQKTMDFHKNNCQLKKNDNFCSIPVCAKKVSVAPANPVQFVGEKKEKLYLAQSHANACLDAEPERISHEITPVGREIVGMDFREGVDYELGVKLGKGGNGLVFDVNLLPCGIRKLNGDYNLVVKWANVRPNEIRVLKFISKYGQFFVQHYFVVYKDQVVEWKEKPKRLPHRMFLKKYDMCLSKLRKSRPGGILSIEEGKFYWVQILRGVVCLHALKPPIVHKDIKAGNVLLTSKTEAGLYSARLADFEYAVVLDEKVETEKLRPCGTPFFAAPEVKLRKGHGTPVDMYSMGAFFLELTIQAATYPRDKVSMVKELKEVEPEFGFLVEWCLQEDPRARPTALKLLNHKIVQKYMKTVSLPFMNVSMPDGVYIVSDPQ